MAKNEQKLVKTNVNVNNDFQLVPMSDIDVDYKWNARSGAWHEDSGTTEDDPGFLGTKQEDGTFQGGFVGSIRATGGLNEVPVVLRPHPDPKSRKKFSLVVGFRRARAVQICAEENGNKEPVIRAQVKPMNETEARTMNIRENSARKDVKVQDLAWSIVELAKLYGTDLTIAAVIGKTQGYVSKLHRIMKETPAEITNNWRESLIPLTVDQMLVVAKQKDDKLKNDKYKEMVKAAVERAREKTDEEKAESKIEGLKKQAHKFGFAVGRLVEQGFFPEEINKLSFGECIELVVKLKDVNARDKAKVARAAEAGYKEGYEFADKQAEEEAEADEETDKAAE